MEYKVTFENGVMKIFDDWNEAIRFGDENEEEYGMWTIEEEE